MIIGEVLVMPPQTILSYSHLEIPNVILQNLTRLIRLRFISC